MSLQRIRDPRSLTAGSELEKANKKLERAMAILALNPNKGGNPLIFAFCAGKPHSLEDIPTAATNGMEFFWGPNRIKELNAYQLTMIIRHEAYHGLLLHCLAKQNVKYPNILNLAADFIVNALVEKEWRNQNNYSLDHVFDQDKHPLWNGPLWLPMNFEQLKESYLNAKENGEIEQKDENGEVIKFRPVDLKALNYTVIELYKELVNFAEANDLIAQYSAYVGDDEHLHIEGPDGRKAYMDAVFNALNNAKRMRGEVPSQVEDALKELTDPTLDLQQYLPQSIQLAKLRMGGSRPTYTRYRRRFLYQQNFFPVNMIQRPTIFVLMDTSGSVSDEELAGSVSELKQFIGIADIFVVPVDAEPHWDAVSKIESESDAPNVRVVGRGGTVFQQFFEEFWKMSRRFGRADLILVLTDGGCDTIPAELDPGIPVAWVINNGFAGFSQAFGQVVHLTPPDANV